jgi:filamentous hemagglutinin family protein
VSSIRRRPAPRWLRSLLLRGASALALASLIGAGGARAQSVSALIHASGVTATSVGVPSVAAPQVTIGASSAAMNAASVRALTSQARVTQAASLAAQAQAAARSSVAALTSSVPDGLAAGGLQPVATPLPAAADPTGLSTWQGASAPSQSQLGGQTTVTVDQTDPRALLSWTTFNVGKNTTLVFSQKQDGAAQPDWVVLNRVVGQIDPATGMRDPGVSPSPSQILGHIKADGEVLILNPNGVLFEGTAQVDTHALVATSLDIGTGLNGLAGEPIPQRNQTFLTYGLLGAQETVTGAHNTFSPEALNANADDPLIEGPIIIDAGAKITSDPTGFLMFLAPRVSNSGVLSSPSGEVALQSGRYFTLESSDGSPSSLDPNVRGLLVSSQDKHGYTGDFVANTVNGVIQADDGYVSLGGSNFGSVIDLGLTQSATSISRNGFVQLSGPNIQLGGVISITPDDAAGTLPQDPSSLGAFKHSQIVIGSAQSLIEIDSSAVIYAPSANVTIGAAAGPTTTQDVTSVGKSRVVIDGSALIDVGGLKDVEVPASRNQILIQPVKQNELADDPNYKSSFLNGAGVYLDPRLSGVRPDGVAWVGSPLVDAASYAQQVGVTASELMTTGGNVVLGVSSFSPRADASLAPDVTVRIGAVIDVSGGWVTYQAGEVRTTQLINGNGQVVDIGHADPNDTYVGVYNGYTATQPRWGISDSFGDPLLLGQHYEAAYTEGRDAGSLTFKSSVVAFDGTVHADAFAGPMQVAAATPGTATPTVYGDLRPLQAAPSQLPAGGFLFIQADGTDNQGNPTGGANIEISADEPAPVTAGYGQSLSLDGSGDLTVPSRDPASLLRTDRLDTITLSGSDLSSMGLGQLSLQTSGKLTIDYGADVQLDPGGVFTALTGRSITVDGSVQAASGKISLATAELPLTNNFSGSAITPDIAALGSFDVTVNGLLSTRGRWVNDLGAAPSDLQGPAYLNGGSISITAAPRVTTLPQRALLSDSQKGLAPAVNQDISGSILIDIGSVLDVSSGGYVSAKGALNLNAKGGNLSLTEQTTYFQLNSDLAIQPGGIPGFRVTGLFDTSSGSSYVPVNPGQINARVFVSPDSIRAQGFGGGGTFSLTTPALSVGGAAPSDGTWLPLDFFNRTGFANFNVVSYGTALVPNAFSNGLGGYNALLQTQTVTVANGQGLLLTQSQFTPSGLLSDAQVQSLRTLPTAGDLYSVMRPLTPTDAWDQLPVNLSLGGLVELKIAQGGVVTGAPGAAISASLLHNQGVIYLPGGTVTQSEVLPVLYTGGGARAVGGLGQVFSAGPGGAVSETAINLLGLKDPSGKLLTNAQAAGQIQLYLGGDIPQGIGMQLDPGSSTNVAGLAIVNPRSPVVGSGDDVLNQAGRVVSGGVIQSLSPLAVGQIIAPLGRPSVVDATATGIRVGDVVSAQGALLDVAGASGSFQERNADGGYTATKVWSDAGSLYFGGGVVLQDVRLQAQGGDVNALGGTLTVPNLVLTQSDLPTAKLNTLSADLIQRSGVATLVAQGSVIGQGAQLSLDRAFFLTSTPYAGQDITTVGARDLLAPTVSALGDLSLYAPYIGLDSSVQTVSTPVSGSTGSHAVTFRALDIDVMGAVRFDQSISQVNLISSGDLRLIGIQPWQQVFGVNAAEPSSLVGQLAVNGDLNLTAAQVYPTTGSTFYVSSAGAKGTIRFAGQPGSAPPLPFSAGGALWVQAANIVQGGVLRVPLGALTLGSNTPLQISTDSALSQVFAPATMSLVVAPGSTTSVSAAGLSIPYGTTIDQTEWFFTPTTSRVLTAPPAAMLTLAGQTVDIAANATVDLRGGGDVYAYEFIPGVGGSRDVLSQQNPDPFTSTNGFQYPDKRQVYAIVPGLSQQAVAAYDPLYSANYASLYGPQAVGMSVFLQGSPQLQSGWYTLLPAQYAMMPGGMRVVLDTSVSSAAPTQAQTLPDGTLRIAGQFGDPIGRSISSTVNLFDIQSQSTFLKYSTIAVTSGDAAFLADALHSGSIVPRLPIDAGRLVLNPVSGLDIGSSVLTTPASGGRGAEADVGGLKIAIVDPGAPTVANTVEVTVPELAQLDATSLFVGGQRTDNADGTTSLNVTAQSIIVATSPGDPLSVPELILAVDGATSNITLLPNTVIASSGTLDVSQTGALLIDGSTGLTGQGALLRIASGPQRLLTRLNVAPKVKPGTFTINPRVALSGQSVEIDSTGAMAIDPSVKLSATNLAIDAPSIDFSATVPKKPVKGVLTLTPSLTAQLSSAANLVLRSPAVIAVDPGAYAFGNLTLDTPGLSLNGTGMVTMKTGVLDLANSFTAGTRCAPCGTGQLAFDSTQIKFDGGVLATHGFGGLVSLGAPSGVFAVGVGGLDVGAAALLVQTPFIGDMGTPATVGSTTSATAGLTLAATGEVIISNPTGAPVPAVDGTPGSSLDIQGQWISVSGVTLRASAGALSLTSSNGPVDVTNGSILETPGYSRSFGDAADPYSISAPGGLLTLTAVGGDLNIDKGTTLSVGGGTGQAGRLQLSASGAVNLAGTLDASAPQGSASFVLDSGSAFDLTAFETRWGSQFTGDFSIRTGAGDLALAAGLDVKASNMSLTADGGRVEVDGKIDVSGVNGGEVDLIGAQGVTLASGSIIDAHADGYGASDTRQASGGTVLLATAGSGVIDVRSGASIDLSAHRPGDRLVAMSRGGAPDYAYVQGDLGGQLTLRAPLVLAGGKETVDVSFAGTLVGASSGSPSAVSSVVLEGFKSFDLAAIAAGPWTGVQQTSPGLITLDLSLPGTKAKPNFLADLAPGSVPDFVQGFDLSAADAHLGGLTGLATFHERPGVELDYSGAVVLASNWNLGAGVVDVAGAVKAGVMAPDPQLPGKFDVIPGDESQVFSNFTHLTYRVGGTVDGEPGALTIRAGGGLTLNGSITDGFFTFADQTDPGYLSLALGGGSRSYQGYLTPNCATLDCSEVVPFSLTGTPVDYVYLPFPTASTMTGTFTYAVPYDAAANAPDALGSGAGGTGDPIGSAQLFPLLQAGGGSRPVDSWSYRLVAGAGASADPLHTTVGSTAGLIVQGLHPYTVSATTAVSTFKGQLDISQLDVTTDADIMDPLTWATAFSAANALPAHAYTILDFSTAPKSAKTILQQDAIKFAADPANAGQVKLLGKITNLAGMSGPIDLMAKFLAGDPSLQGSLKFSQISSFFRPPSSRALKSITAYAPTLIRTGTGDIALAAAGDVDLRNGATPTYETAFGKTATAKTAGALQLGGVAVYTAGHLVDLSQPLAFADPATGSPAFLDATASGSSTNIFTQLSSQNVTYAYGASAVSVGSDGLPGVMMANPVYAQGGGNISVTAGRDVLGRRDVWLETTTTTATANGNFLIADYAWIGNGDQPWRSGAVNQITDIRLDPQLFQEGLGALAGGNVTVSAGRDVSDISTIDTASVATAQITTSATSGAPSSGQALMTFGGGDVNITATGDLLGGRLYVSSGQGQAVVGGDIASAGQIGQPSAKFSDTLVLRLSDATIDLQAGGSAELQGITALGVVHDPSQAQSNLDAAGFYSPDAGVSIVANGSVKVDNLGANVLAANNLADKNQWIAVYPGSFRAASLAGDLTVATPDDPSSVNANSVVLYPSPTGQLTLAAAGDINATTIDMEDGDPNQLPGALTNFAAEVTLGAISGRGFLFPGVFSDTSEPVLRTFHNRTPTHLGQNTPNRIYAGRDITGMILSTPMQTRIGAGRDIVNMMYFGQNLASSDITRIVAGRDILGTTKLINPFVNSSLVGAQLPAVEGNTFVIGGPGSFFLEAGRDLGPFLNSAVTPGFLNQGGLTAQALTFGGGVLAVGDDWNPWLAPVSASVYTEFGVAKGQDFAALREAYLDPANLTSMPDYLFQQTTSSIGAVITDRTKPVYAPILISWMQANQGQLLASMFGTTNVSFAQAYQAFASLPALLQRTFLLKYVYFNELKQPAIPGPSFHVYKRGYTAVNTLFPASLGYTANDLTGASNGSKAPVATGNLDLRLATIQTDWGGDVFILGPGGRVLGGSTVRTSEQASRRAYDGGRLFAGSGATLQAGTPLPANILSIPVGFEGVLTLQGGGVYAFTDRSFLLNQSRLFTEEGGDIVMWSSNGDLNAGQGPKTTPDIPPVQVKIDENAISIVNQDSAVSGAGIGAFQPDPNGPKSSVFLLAPAGTVDAGAAGVRVVGDLYVAAAAVANSDNFKVSGASIGLPVTNNVNIGAETSASAAAAQAAQVAQSVAGAASQQPQRSIITVNVEGYTGGDCPPDDTTCKR